MKKTHFLRVISLLLPLLLLISIVGCAQPAATPVPTPAAEPSLSPAAPTTLAATPRPTPPPSPSPPPKPAFTPTPPATTKPAASPSSSPSPSPKPTPAVTTPAPLTPAPTPNFIYTENFTKPGGWYTTTTDKYEIGYPAAGQAPGYYVTLKAPNAAIYTLDKFFGNAFDFTIQIDAKALTEQQGLYGIAFRQNEKGDSSYRFGVDYLTGRYSLSKVVSNNSTYLIPWTVSPLLIKGVNQTNRLMVETKGNTFNLYANGYLLISYVDTRDPFRYGLVRVMAISGSKPDVRFVFNDFKMRSD